LFIFALRVRGYEAWKINIAGDVSQGAMKHDNAAFDKQCRAVYLVALQRTS
jgi:hypothetical protein